MEANSTTLPTTMAPKPENDAFENLFPALLECFAIIFAGYFAGRISLISQHQGKGLTVFVSKFAMPSLLFRNMCQLHFGVVDWYFLLSIFIGKVAVFIAVALFTLMLIRPVHFGKMGIYGIFVTQSHDFALGIPIVHALYSKTHPEYENYLYLVAPISVAFLNPIGFLLLEMDKWRKSSPSRRRISKYRALGQVLAGVASNPIVFMTVLGIIGNFVFHQKVPSYLDNILMVLAQAFAATSLFCLGHSMVFISGGSVRGSLLTLSLLISAKMLISPLLIRELVYATHPHTNSTELIDLSTYGFLYGTFPTAPTVYIYSTLYSVQTGLMATGMVVSTFLAAPIMFVSARLMTLPVVSETMYKKLIYSTAFDISIISSITCVWVLIVFLIHKRVKMVPHQMTMCLVISQLVACIGLIIKQFTDSTVAWQHYIQFVPYFVGVTGTRCWMSCVAVCLCLLKVRGLCYVLKNKVFFHFYGFGLPTLLCGLLFMIAKQDYFVKDDPCFMFGAYGKAQGILSSCVLLVNVIITIGAITIRKRSEEIRSRFDSECSNPGPDCRRFGAARSERLSNPIAAGRRTYGTEFVAGSAPPIMGWTQQSQQESTSVSSNQESLRAPKKGKVKKGKFKKSKENCATCQSNDCGPPSVRNIEDLVPDVPRVVRSRAPTVDDMDRFETSDEENERSSLLRQQPCVSQDQCTLEQRRRCESLLETYNSLQTLSEDDPMEEEELPQYDVQETRHVILLLILLASSILGAFLLTWRLTGEKESGVFVELEFMDTFLMFGQGFFSFLIFGLDQKMVIEPFMKKVRQLIYRRKTTLGRSLSELDQETLHTCEQFTTYHRDRCKEVIASERSYHTETYHDAFTGTELIDWLLEVGLANERSDGVVYGKRLLDGRIIQHVTGLHHFMDMPYFYQFCEYELMNGDSIPETRGTANQRRDSNSDVTSNYHQADGDTTTSNILVHV